MTPEIYKDRPPFHSDRGRAVARFGRHLRRAAGLAFDMVEDVALALRSLMAKPATSRDTDGLGILMIDDLLPDPLFGAGYPRAHAIVRSLIAAGHRVDFYPMQASRSNRARMVTAFAGSVRFHRGRGARGLHRLLRRDGNRFDLLFVSRPTPMHALSQVCDGSEVGRTAVIYDAEAVLAPREARRRALFDTTWSEAELAVALGDELSLMHDVQAITAVGQGDAATIASVVDVPVFVLPHPVAVRDQRSGFDERRDLLFVGRLTGDRSESPNVDSILWFAAEVMPALDAMIGTGYRLHVVGRIESAAIAALGSERIVLHGLVDDVTDLYDGSRLFVAPTRYAAGIPLKVIEAMGEGIPCVVTPLLAEQLAAAEGALAIGEGADGFAQRCADLYQDASRWRETRDAGIAHVRRTCSPAAFDRDLQDLLARVVARRLDAGGC